MKNVSVATRDKAGDAKALADLIDPKNLSGGETIVKNATGTYIKSTTGGMTLLTRVA